MEIEIGLKIGRLTILKEAGRNKYNRLNYLCLCDCGQEIIVCRNSLGKNTRSCGCLKMDLLIARNIIHGQRHIGNTSKEYKCWQGMKERCLNPKKEMYCYYGGRGIKVCDRWKNSFISFYEDMGKSEEGTSLERIDCNGDYCPENCKWATSIEQANNRTDNRILEIDGEKLTAIQASRKFHINYGTLLSRLNSGWSVERALKTPTKKINWKHING